MEVYLPEYCYRNKPVQIKGIVNHYFSAINVDPVKKYDLQTCWNLMHDLNAPKDNRFQFPDVLPINVKRSYASAHCFIGRKGELWMTVPEDMQAYHAGKSLYRGLTSWNQWSYGIEWIGSSKSGFTAAQYATAARLHFRLMQEYQIPLSMVVGHETIAPGRKKDPGIATGNFDMDRLITLITKFGE
jgi:N-acetyl-anhydromuramyl-L-alanine amidase AmpD